MISYYIGNGGKITEISELQTGSWVSLINPSEQELCQVERALGAEPSLLRAALDAEETSHIDIEDDQTLIIVEDSDEPNTVVYSTLPVGILVLPEHVVTVALKETTAFADIKRGRVRNLSPAQKTKFVLQTLLRVANRYLYDLKQIDKTSHEVEKQLHKSMKNKELFQLLELEKSLVYFTTSLQSNSITIKKILSGRVLKLY